MNRKQKQNKISIYFSKKCDTRDEKKISTACVEKNIDTSNLEDETQNHYENQECLTLEKCTENSLFQKSKKRKDISPTEQSDTSPLKHSNRCNINDNVFPKCNSNSKKIRNDDCAIKDNMSINKNLTILDKENHCINLSFGSMFDNDFSFDEDLNSAFVKEDERLHENLLNLKIWQRCTILEIKEIKHGKSIYLESTKSKQRTWCNLQFPWFSCKFDVGDIINIKATPSIDDNVKWVLNATGGYLVTNPDNLVSGTTVVGSLFCARKGVLSDIFKGIDCENKVMTIGSLVHELFQTSLKHCKVVNININFVQKLWKELLNDPSTIIMLYRSQISTDEATIEIYKFIPRIIEFINQYIYSDNIKSSLESRKNIDEVLDIEENLWVPQLGLKGKIDVTCQVKIHDLKKIRTPLELKTGRANLSAEHRGQLILYIMMMQELGFDVEFGLLLYLKEGIIKEVAPTYNDMRDLIMLRNEINYFIIRKRINEYIHKSSGTVSDLSMLDIDLPEPINHHSACQKCPYLTLCSTYLNKDTKIQLPTNHNLAKVSLESISHLSENHIEYFFKWSRMAALEDSVTQSNNNQLWTLTPEERESKGNCISNLKIDSKVMKTDNRYLHCFKRDKEIPSIFADGDYVIISTNKQFNIASGNIQSVAKNIVLVYLSKDISIIFGSCAYNIDSYIGNSQLSFNLTNLGLLLDDIDQSAKLRKLIIDKIKPKFDENISLNLPMHLLKLLEDLNDSQKNAVLRVLSAKDYLLIQGMPGTGKTQTVVAIIKLMVSLNKTVLITSHTHSAVDNVLLKLQSAGLDFLRIGSVKRIHPLLLYKSEEHLTSSCSTVEEVQHVYNSANVIGVTCLGSAHPLLSHRAFDICIVDESTQVLQCSVLRPLFSASKFILIGDPEQLPPVVKSKEAKKFGFDKSLFEQLADAGGTVLLTIQYRMNIVITNLINKLTYNNLLKCANSEVSENTIKVDNCILKENYFNETWLHDVVSSNLLDSVIFTDTGETYSLCSERNQYSYLDLDLSSYQDHITKLEKCSNICESNIVIYIISALIKIGIKADDIGIIAPYRLQVDLIQNALSGIDDLYLKSVEVNTVDQFQGRDKDIIIYSCTKSFPAEVESEHTRNLDGEILNDKRRLTVALTRSKKKLIIVGDFSTLINYSPFAELLSHVRKENIINLLDKHSHFDWNHIFDKVDGLLKNGEVTML